MVHLEIQTGEEGIKIIEIEVDIQFMRNNMTASMFDLSMKDKSRNPFGKLKDKIKGKNMRARLIRCQPSSPRDALG